MTVYSEGEKALWSAVIVRAIEDYVDTRKSRIAESNRRSARKWLTSNKMNISSFVWASEMLGLDVSAVREHLRL
jgi:hypothetical protein